MKLRPFHLEIHDYIKNFVNIDLTINLRNKKVREKFAFQFCFLDMHIPVLLSKTTKEIFDQS